MPHMEARPQTQKRHADPNEETKIRCVIKAVGAAEFQDRVHILAATFKRNAIDEPGDGLARLVMQLQSKIEEMRAEQAEMQAEQAQQNRQLAELQASLSQFKAEFTGQMTELTQALLTLPRAD